MSQYFVLSLKKFIRTYQNLIDNYLLYKYYVIDSLHWSCISLYLLYSFLLFVYVLLCGVFLSMLRLMTWLCSNASCYCILTYALEILAKIKNARSNLVIWPSHLSPLVNFVWFCVSSLLWVCLGIIVWNIFAVSFCEISLHNACD